MIPKEIAFELVELKEKSKTYSAIQRSYKIDEIRADVAKINDEIGGLVRNVDNILVDGLISKFEIEIWFEAMKDKTDFTEPNPMLVYEEQQRVLERQRKIVEEQEKQEIERQRKIEKEKEKQRLEEIERQKKFEEEKAKREAEEFQKRLEAQQKEKQEEIERQIRKAEVEAQQKREEIFRQNKIDAEAARQKQIEIERKRQVNNEKAKREAEELQKRLQVQRIEEFRKMCEYGQENIFILENLMNEGLDITKIADFDCLMSCLEHRKRADFIRFLVDSEILVTNKHIKYCYANTKYFKDAPTLINILENAKKLDSEAFEYILKKTKFNVIGTISATCICIFFLFMPQILNREIDNFYYILDGIITILFLFISISFIVDLRKRLKINNSNQLLDNQAPHPKQAGYERPNAKGKIGIAGSVKEFNHKKIKRRKLILWIVVTLISISIIALIYIYFKEIMGFFKILLIILLLPLLLPIILKKR